MTRDFLPDAVSSEILDEIVALASRAPSAGKTQGWHLVLLEGTQTAQFWDITLPAERRATFRWQGLLRAPVVALVLADPQAYLERYAEPDKAATGLGASAESWPTPYWTVDTAMAVMTLLLAAEDRGLGTLFFGVFREEMEVRAQLGIPADLQMIGAIALGYRAPDDGRGHGRSAQRPRRTPAEIIHRGRW